VGFDLLALKRVPLICKNPRIFELITNSIVSLIEIEWICFAFTINIISRVSAIFWQLFNGT